MPQIVITPTTIRRVTLPPPGAMYLWGEFVKAPTVFLCSPSLEGCECWVDGLAQLCFNMTVRMGITGQSTVESRMLLISHKMHKVKGCPCTQISADPGLPERGMRKFMAGDKGRTEHHSGVRYFLPPEAVMVTGCCTTNCT